MGEFFHMRGQDVVVEKNTFTDVKRICTLMLITYDVDRPEDRQKKILLQVLTTYILGGYD